jgi:hypothetical protein
VCVCVASWSSSPSSSSSIPTPYRLASIVGWCVADNMRLLLCLSTRKRNRNSQHNTSFPFHIPIFHYCLCVVLFALGVLDRYYIGDDFSVDATIRLFRFILLLMMMLLLLLLLFSRSCKSIVRRVVIAWVAYLTIVQLVCVAKRLKSQFLIVLEFW